MKATVIIRGREYVPLAAVPSLSGGFLCTNDVAHMLADPEAYCDIHNDTVLSALKIAPSGNPEAPARAAFKQWAEASSPAMLLEESAAILVPLESIHRLFGTVVRGMGASGKLNGIPVWDPKAKLPPKVQQAIRDRCLSPLRGVDTRANSKLAKLARMVEALASVEQKANQCGVPFERQQLLGRKKDLLDILIKIDPTVAMSESTFDSHYAPDLGLRWRQGSKAKDVKPCWRRPKIDHFFGVMPTEN